VTVTKDRTTDRAVALRDRAAKAAADLRSWNDARMEAP
jgi:hypothetical protein